MLEGTGLTVIDPGVNVPAEEFVEQVDGLGPDTVGFSGRSADASGAVKKATQPIELRRERVPA